MNELQQLYQLRETQTNAVNVTELAIVKMERKHRTFDIDSIRAKLCGKTFISREYDTTFYKILDISDIHEEGVYCTAIEIRQPSATNNNSHASNKQEYYFHNFDSIEMDIAEFDAKFNKIVKELISINLTN